MRALAALCLLLTGCASEPRYIPYPEQKGMVVTGYQSLRVFNGLDFELGLPFLEPVPVVGPVLSKIVHIKLGQDQDVIAPILHERSHEAYSFATGTSGWGRWLREYRLQQPNLPGHGAGCR